MTEHETDPHRQPASSDATASNAGVSNQTSGLPWQAAAATPPAEADRSQADRSPAQPTGQYAPAPESPAGSYPPPASPAVSPQASQWSQSGWQASEWQPTESGYQSSQAEPANPAAGGTLATEAVTAGSPPTGGYPSAGSA
jgi:hypothetical protein